MKKHPIATIVNFCSNERRFIQATLDQAALFSSQVIVPVCDHFFDGTSENRPLLEKIYSSFPNCLFLEYPYIPEKIPKKLWKKVSPAHFWHSVSRVVGFSAVDDEAEMVLFLDADEVPDGEKVGQWLDSSDYRHHTALKLANYWYFRDPRNQALQFEDSIVLAQKRALDLDILLHQDERDAIYHLLPGPKRRRVAGSDGEPMFHHYSWVRTQEEMLQKVRAWGHHKDRDWTALVLEEFGSDFRGTDFVHGYSYQTVAPRFEIRLEEALFTEKGAPRVRRLDPQTLLKLLRLNKFPNFLDF